MVLRVRNTTAATKAKNDRPKRIEDPVRSHYYDVKNSPDKTHNICVLNTLAVGILIDYMLWHTIKFF